MKSAIGLTRTYRPGDEAGIRAIMEAGFDVDRIPGWTRLDIERAIGRLGVDPGDTIVIEDEDGIAGYAILRFDDLTVHPDRRRRGLGRRLVEAARAAAAERGEALLNLYVPAHLPGSIAFAEALGFAYRKSMWLFELGADIPVPAAVFPDRVATEPWSSDVDVDAYVAFANAAFEGHPTPLDLSADLVRRVESLPDFIADGVLLLRVDGRLVGFTKTERVEDVNGRRIGYISQIGVLPAWRGQGLGRELLRWGVNRLRVLGAEAVQLSVEAWNERALELYRRTGFEPIVEWPHWVLPTGPR